MLSDAQVKCRGYRYQLGFTNVFKSMKIHVVTWEVGINGEKKSNCLASYWLIEVMPPGLSYQKPMTT